MKGNIIFYNPTKAKGVLNTDAGTELSFDITNLNDGVTPDQIQEGVEVYFEETFFDNIPRADNIGIVNPSNNEDTTDYLEENA